MSDSNPGARVSPSTQALRQIGALGAALVVTALVFARTGIPSWIPRGTLPSLGIPSPLSGMTRSFVALASGDLVSSFRWHPLGPVVFGACVAMSALAVASMMGTEPPRRLRAVAARTSSWVIVSACFALVWVRQLVVLGR